MSENQIQVYCLKCKKNNNIKENYKIHKTDKAYQLKGLCSECDSKVCKFLKKDDPLIKLNEECKSNENDKNTDKFIKQNESKKTKNAQTKKTKK